MSDNSARKSKARIIRDIQDKLSYGEYSIKKLAEEIDSQWSTVRDTLELLKGMGVVDERREEGGDRIFSLARPKATDTLFQLPISEEDRQISSYLFKRIVEEWRKLKGTRPSKTQVQKAAVKIVEKEKLHVSYGWYLFGQTLSLQYAEARNYDVTRPNLNESVEYTIISVVKEECNKTTKQIVSENHKNNYIYCRKDWLDHIFHQQIFEDNKEKIEAVFDDLERELQKENLTLRELFNYFTSVFLRLMRSSINLNEISQRIIDAFEQTWKVLAGSYYFKTLSIQVTIDVEKRLSDKILDAELAIAKLEEYLPRRIIQEKDIYNLIGSSQIKPVSSEEKKKAIAALETDSNIFRRHNLNGAKEI